MSSCGDLARDIYATPQAPFSGEGCRKLVLGDWLHAWQGTSNHGVPLSLCFALPVLYRQLSPPVEVRGLPLRLALSLPIWGLFCRVSSILPRLIWRAFCWVQAGHFLFTLICIFKVAYYRNMCENACRNLCNGTHLLATSNAE